ncbi:hypothetical protein [Seongchinamella sediminis]|uniref:hypothetical protein n=1 Tax=Seongchinamella sediminis TaxID=2283635 RepID=UPI001058A7AE|nr:hypothetical protein [Seongchinamella sediminis]
MSRDRRIFPAVLVALAWMIIAPGQAAARSPLSQWLSDTALVEIKSLAAGHPRLAYRSLHVSPRSGTALDEAIAITVQKSLGKVAQLQLVTPVTGKLQPAVPAASVDELLCQHRPRWDNELQVIVRELERGRAAVELELVDMAEPSVAFRRWRWQGRLSAAERDYQAMPARLVRNDGSPGAPWTEAELEQAAAQLTEQLACSLRPNIIDRVSLQWPQPQTVPAPLALAVSETRRRLDYYREINQVRQGADYRVQVDWHPVGEDIWQLSLAGTPQSAQLARVQVATYIAVQLPVASAGKRPRLPVPAVALLEPRSGQPASSYLQVEMLDVSHSDRGLASAELRVRLRLVNRASRPLEYGLSLSGGHYLHCIPEPQYYRHQRYGYAEGRLGPGESSVRDITVAGARHKPHPLFGTPRCAGFQGLEGLEDFASEGHKVTQFIRWSL